MKILEKQVCPLLMLFLIRIKKTDVKTFEKQLSISFTQGLQSSGVVLAMELFPTNYRSYIGALCGVTGNIGALCFGLLVYLVKDWRYVQLALSIASFVQIFSLW